MCVCVFWNKESYKFSIFLKLEMGGQANSLIHKKRGGGKQNKKEYLHLRFRVAFFFAKTYPSSLDSRSLSRCEF